MHHRFANRLVAAAVFMHLPLQAEVPSAREERP